MDSPTFASFLTPEGIVVAGGLITAFIQLLKAVFPIIDATISGAVQAFLLSAVLYLVTALVVGLADANAYLTLIASWLACATAAVGVHSTVKYGARNET